MNDTQGKLLVAPPGMPDWRFQKTVVYMWRHDVAGAAGVIINKKCNHPDFKHICNEGSVPRKEGVNLPVYYGGPVMNNIVGILHSKDFMIGRLCWTRQAAPTGICLRSYRACLFSMCEGLIRPSRVRLE